jgi:SulP family sulfate permease
MEVIATVGSGNDHTFVLNMQHVPTIDVTALVALESALDRLYRSRIKVIFAGLTPEVAELLDRAGIKRQPGRLAYAPDVETAISMAIVRAARLAASAPPPPAAA